MRSNTRWALIAIIAGGCGDDGTGGARDAADAADVSDAAGETEVAAEIAGGDADAAAETSTGACPFTGTWNLQNVLCGDNDITADWFRVIDRTTLVLTVSGSGCASESTNETDACKEVERGTMVANGPTWKVTSQGIASCAPAGCTFGGQDAACVVGDRAATYDATIAVAEGRLSFASPVGVCAAAGSGTATTFVFEQR